MRENHKRSASDGRGPTSLPRFARPRASWKKRRFREIGISSRRSTHTHTRCILSTEDLKIHSTSPGHGVYFREIKFISSARQSWFLRRDLASSLREKKVSGKWKIRRLLITYLDLNPSISSKQSLCREKLRFRESVHFFTWRIFCINMSKCVVTHQINIFYFLDTLSLSVHKYIFECLLSAQNYQNGHNGFAWFPRKVTRFCKGVFYTSNWRQIKPITIGKHFFSLRYVFFEEYLSHFTTAPIAGYSNFIVGAKRQNARKIGDNPRKNILMIINVNNRARVERRSRGKKEKELESWTLASFSKDPSEGNFL